jgi:predicted extracellular nuclease
MALSPNRLSLSVLAALASLSITAPPAHAQLVISQVYGGGGATSGSPSYRQDYIELFNAGETPVPLAGLSLQYGSATGNIGSVSSNVMALPDASVAPRRYFLVGVSSGTLGATLPALDASGNLTLSATAGKVALVQGTAALNCGGGTACSAAQSAQLRDLVGYGAANLHEGSGPAPALSSTTAAWRAAQGCTDTNDNAADFRADTPAPRNSATAAATCTVAPPPVATLVPIHQIQGAGTTSPLQGRTVRTEGVVTLVTNNGFFMQSLTPDNDPATSEGIFVFTSTAPTVSPTQLVRLTGLVDEFNTGAASNTLTAANPVTQLRNVTDLQTLGSGHVIAPTPIVFPELTEGDLEQVEGMLVRIDTTLTASQNYFLGRYGQITLSAEGRLRKPTNLHPAGSADAQALADSNARRRVILDDGSTRQNPNPTPYIGEDNTHRAGDTISGLVGVIDYGLATASNTGLADYRIHPTEPVHFTRSNPRTAAPADVGGNLKVASFNVLNYFNGDGLGGGFPTSRGASTPAEFARQRAKIIAALKAIDADIVGLMEIENDGVGPRSAIADLVQGLNTALGHEAYAITPPPSVANGTGTDEIKVAFIHKPAKVSPLGEARSDTRSVHNRPPLAQTFTQPNGERLTVVVNHFKSKSCGGAAGADQDAGDGQGCYNATRVAQAQALTGFVQDVLAQDQHAHALVIGDLNAYGKEDPILTLAAAGYVDLLARSMGEAAATYVFDGEQGYLDHAQATAALAERVTGAHAWAINADEPSVIDYNLEFKQPACPACGPDYYSATPYRSSDHDPVIVGLDLRKRILGTAGRDTLSGTAGDDWIAGLAGADSITGGPGRDLFVYLSARDGGDTISDFTPGEDQVDVSALRAQVASSDLLASGHIVLVDTAQGLEVRFDADGTQGPAAARALATLRGVRAGAFVASRDLRQ